MQYPEMWPTKNSEINEQKNYKRGVLFLKNMVIFAAQKIYLMANHSATRKSVRKTAKRNERNRYQGKTTRNAIRDFKVIDVKATALETLPELTSKIDKLAKRGIIHKNKAANLKSKLTRGIQTLAK